jgi:tetratricopeptide (TPR) repeat protein
MARRQINKKFLAIFGGSVVGVVAIGFVAQKLLIKAHPDRYVSDGKQAMASHQWADAVADFGKAAAIAPQDAEIFTEYGQALHIMGVNQDPDIIRKTLDLQAWNHALEIQPDYLPALKCLVNYWKDRMAGGMSAEVYQSAREDAEKFLNLAPDDPSAEETRLFLFTSTIQGWLAGVETNDDRVNDTLKQIRDTIPKDPANAELPFLLALADVRRANDVAKTSPNGELPDSAAAQYRQAATDMESSLKGQDKNSAIHFRAAQIYGILAQVDEFGNDERQQMQSLSDRDMDVAVELLQPSDPMFVQISLQAASLAVSKDNIPKAQRLIHTLLQQQGTDPAVVIQAAQLLEVVPQLRAEGMETLRSAIASTSNGPMNYRRFSLLRALTDLQINEFADATEPGKSQLRADIEGNLKQMTDANLESLPVTVIQARMDLAEQDYVDAIRILTEAINGDQRAATDFEMLWLTAQAYDKTREREQAADYLRRALVQRPEFLPARKMLITELLTAGTEEAHEQIGEQLAFLNKRTPNDPIVLRLEISQLDPTKDADQIKTLYAKLPEQNVNDLRAKAALAVAWLKDTNEGIRLFKLAVAAGPSDVRTVIQLARLEAYADRRADAAQVVQDSLKIHPDDTSLQVLLLELQNQNLSMDDLKKRIAQIEEENPDPVARNMTEAQNAIRAKNWPDAESHLKAAEAADPTKKEIWDALFQVYLMSGQYDKLQTYLQKLGDANFDEAHGLLYQFKVAQAKHDVDRQMDIGQQLVGGLPEFAMSYYSLGQAFQAKGDYQSAIDNYDTALRKKKLVEAMRAEIDCYYAMNRPEAAKVAIDEAGREFPDDLQFRILKILYELNYGDPESANNDLEDLRKLKPDIAEVWLDLANAKLRIAANRSQIGDDAGAAQFKNAAVDVLQKAIGNFPDDPRFYNRLASVLLERGDFDEGEKLLQALGARPQFQNSAQAALMLAQYYEKAHQYDKAEQAYYDAFGKSQQNPIVQMALADLLAVEKKYDQALGLLSLTNENDPRIQRKRLAVLIAAKRTDDIRSTIQALLAQNPPDTAELQTAWARIEMDAGNSDVARQHVDAALAAKPKSADALALRGLLRMHQTPPDADGAIADMTAARALAPNDVDILTSLADAYMYRFDAENAGHMLEAALRLHPERVSLRLRLIELYQNVEPVRHDDALTLAEEGLNQPGGDQSPGLLNAQAIIFQSMGKTDQALQVAQDAMQKFPGDIRVFRTYMDLLLDSGHYQTVVGETNQLLQKVTTLWWIWGDRGRAEAGLGDKTSGMADLQKALQIADANKDEDSAVAIVRTIARSIGNPQAIDIVRTRAESELRWQVVLITLYNESGNYGAAIDILDPLIAHAGDLPPSEQVNIYQIGGMVYSGASPKSYPDKAYDTYKKLLAINPNNVQALNNIACLCAEQFTPPRIQEGMGYIQTAMDLLERRHNTDPMVEDSFGWLLILNGQTQEGMNVLQKAIDREPFPDAYYHMAEGYLRMNDPESAQRQINLALEAIAKAQEMNEPVTPGIRDKLENLSNRVLDSLRTRTAGGGQ